MGKFIYNTKNYNVFHYSEKLAKRGDFIVLNDEQGQQYLDWAAEVRKAVESGEPCPQPIRFDMQTTEVNVLPDELKQGDFVAEPLSLSKEDIEPTPEVVLEVQEKPKAPATPAIDPDDLGSLLDGAESN